MPQPDAIIDDLHAVLAEDETLTDRLQRSLVTAGERARADLDPTLYAAFQWPADLEEYEAYLKAFIRWIPQQSDAQAWREQAPEERYAQEVSDRIAHFFFLVDQDVDGEGTAIGQDSDRFRGWLTQFARQWGSFLNAPESFSQDILQSFLDNAPEYTIEESLIDGKPNTPSGWLTFNQFFARELNAGLRPIADPGSNLVVTSPADATYRHTFDVDEQSRVPGITIKKTHGYASIGQLLEGSAYAEAFVGGTFVHFMLPPSSYHRYHLPVGGTVKESYLVSGLAYLQSVITDGQLESKDSAQTGYEFTQERGVVVLDTADDDGPGIGLVAVVPVGMSHVDSVTLTTVVGTHAAKGEEFGFFQFGGSDIIILLQASARARVDTTQSTRKVGTPVATCHPQGTSA